MIALGKVSLRRFILGAQSKPFMSIIEVIDPEKPSFRPSKWPQKFRNQKTAKNSKLPEDCLEPVGIGGWPPISTWMNPPSLGSNGLHCIDDPDLGSERTNYILNTINTEIGRITQIFNEQYLLLINEIG
jgi:hypothetical protein